MIIVMNTRRVRTVQCWRRSDGCLHNAQHRAGTHEVRRCRRHVSNRQHAANAATVHGSIRGTLAILSLQSPCTLWAFYCGMILCSSTYIAQNDIGVIIFFLFNSTEWRIEGGTCGANGRKLWRWQRHFLQPRELTALLRNTCQLQ